MFIFQVEDVRNCWGELPRLIEAHRKELRGDEDESYPDQEWYNGLYEDGRLVFYSVRLEQTNELVGYSTVVLANDNQREGYKNAHQDALFIEKKYRIGSTGAYFLRYIERDCCNRGAIRIFQSVTPSKDFSKLLLRGGYKLATTIYAKILLE